MRFNRSLKVVGAHAEGEVGNVVVGGIGQVPGETMFDKRNHLAEHRDWIRRLVLSEPRGQVARNANVILPSNHPDADAGYVIMESIEYPVMSGPAAAPQDLQVHARQWISQIRRSDRHAKTAWRIEPRLSERGREDLAEMHTVRASHDTPAGPQPVCESKPGREVVEVRVERHRVDAIHFIGTRHRFPTHAVMQR